MRNFRSMTAVILALCLCLGLAACGQAPEQDMPEPQASAPAQTDGQQLEQELVEQLTLTKEALPGGLASLDAMSGRDGEFVLAGQDSSGQPVLGVLDAQGAFEALALPEDVLSVDAVCRTGEGAAALAFTEAGACILSYSGGEPSRVELAAEAADHLYGDLGLAVRDGNYYVMYYMGIVEFGPDGQAARSCMGEEKWSYFTSMQEADGRIYVAMGDGMAGGGTLCELDTENMALVTADTGELGVTVLGLSAEGGLLLSGELEGRDVVAEPGEGGPAELFDWSEPGVAVVTYLGLWEQPDGSYILFRPGATELERLTLQLTKPKTELRVLTDYAGTVLYDLVNAFNQEDPDYKLRVESLYDEGMSMELLNTQLIAGEGPDIFAFCYYDNLTRLGPAATEDLLPYLDADAEYSRETIVPSLLAAMSPQGKLAALPYAFSMVTFTAPSNVFAEPGISFDEAKAAAEAADLPIFPPWMAQDILWGWMSNFAAVQFTDLEAGTCSFDSEAYLSLLRECGETSTELPADISQNNVGLLQFETLQNFMRLGVISERYGGEYTFAGMPNDETNGSMFSVDLSFAISAQSKYKDGAWRFVRECLSPEVGGSGAEGSGSSFPASAEWLEKLLQTVVDEGIDNYGEMITISEADADKFRELVEGTTTVQYSLPTVTDILNEDASQYFAGQTSAEQAAEYSQNRVSTWLAEQG